MVKIEQDLSISRYPESRNKSLQAWNAADEYVLKYLEQLNHENPSVAVYNDRFGFLSCALHQINPLSVIDHKSREKALVQNIHKNSLNEDDFTLFPSLSPLPRPVDIGLINIPKSLDHFRFYLDHLSEALRENGLVICSFMTRHFSPKIPAIGEEFFHEAEQSLAWKKSRLLILKRKKPRKYRPGIQSFTHTYTTGTTEEVKQYPGVFSAGKVDIATRFLLENIQPEEQENRILDLASGNGVIARDLQLRKPDAEIHLIDDFLPAVESSKLNLNNKRTFFHYNDSLEDFEKESFDLVVSNPPFHFEHENNIEITLSLFRQVSRILNREGRFICVANRHLNYKTHIAGIFKQSDTLAENNRFIVYQNRDGRM